MSLNLLLFGVDLFVLGGVVIGLHHLRSRYGLTPMLIFMGGLTAAVQLSSLFGVFVKFSTNLTLPLASSIFVPVILLAILLIYATEGTAPARTAIWGVVAVIVLTLVAIFGLSFHLNLPGSGSFWGITYEKLVFHFSARIIAASMIAFIVDMYILVILYQLIINRFGFSEHLKSWNAPLHSRLSIWLAVFVALLGAIWMDVLVFSSIAYLGTPQFREILLEQFIGKTLTGILLGPFAGLYLFYCTANLSDFSNITQRRSFDVLFGFYGQLASALARSEISLIRRVDELAAIHAISQEITNSSDLDMLLEKIVESAARLLASPSGGLYLCDAEKGEVRCMVSFRTPSDDTGEVLKYGEGSAGIVAETGVPLIINEYAKWPQRASSKGAERPFTAMISVPLIWQSQVTGVLRVLDNIEDRQFTQDDLELLSLFANQAAIALENARLLMEINESLVREKHLSMIARTLSSALDLPTVLSDVVRLAAELIGADAGALSLLESDGHTLRYPYLHNMPSELSTWEFPDEIGLAWDVLKTGNSILLSDYPASPKAHPEWVKVGVISVVIVPVAIGNNVVGTLGLFGLTAETQFEERDIPLVQAVGRQAGIAIHNAQLFEESQRKMRELGAVIEASLDTSSVLEVEILLNRIYLQVERLFAPDSFAVVRYEPEEETLQILLAIEENQKLPEWIGARFALEDGGLSGWVIKNQQVLIVKDTEKDPLPIEPIHSDRPARSWLGVPLVAHERVLGAISVQSFQPNMFDEVHCRLLETLASQIAIALENADYATELERNLAEMSALYDLAQKTTSSLDADEVLTRVVKNLRDMLEARAATIVLLDTKTQTLTLGATAGVEPQWVQKFILDVGEGVSGKVVETGQPSYVPDTYAVPDFKFFSRQVRSLMVVPLKAKDSIIGTLTIDSDRPNAFTTRDERLLTIAASQVTVAIENAQLYTKVQKLAVTDGLTHVANRRAFDDALRSEVVRATRYNHPLSLVFMDIDDFKSFNDTHGHPAGDKQLREIAEILNSSVRLPDLVARYGGEEFVLLLPHTGKDGACYLAERIRIAAESKALELMPGAKSTLKSNGSISGYTLSIGVASIPDDAQSAEELLQAADWGVLEAKQTGKNRVCAA